MTATLATLPACAESFVPPVFESPCPDSGACFKKFGCEVNSVSIDELFSRYGEIGFLYPEKLKRLQPYLPTIIDNWRKALQLGDAIHRVVTYDDSQSGAWASISTWRTTTNGWSSQHLVSVGNPVASRAVMLAESEANQHQQNHRSNQNWFRPDNRMPKRIFGSIVESLGQENASVDCLNYVEVTPVAVGDCRGNFHVFECTASDQEDLYDLAVATRGQVYADAEDLTEDLNLAELDEIYQEAGLRRYRRVWIVRDKCSNQALAALVAYRGPLGFNFSFLENRADLLVSDAVADEHLSEIVSLLVTAASTEYADFEPGFIPVIADDRSARVLELRGDRIVRQYCQSIWLKDGYKAWYDHTEKFYSRIMQRMARTEEQKVAG